jgi:plasmid stabilization system protein ParE
VHANDLELIYSYLEQRSSSAAEALKATIKRRISSLGVFPFIAPYNEALDLHELTISGHPYKVYYQVHDSDVWIIHIRHTARRPLERGDL